MISWLVIVIGLAASWSYTALESPSTFQNTVCPLLVTVFLISLLLKVVFLMGPSSGRGGHGGDCGGFGGSGGGDCGGDGGGC